MKELLAKLSPFFRSAMVVFVAFLFVTSVVMAATTIGTDITTTGGITTTGAINATTTNVGTLTVEHGWTSQSATSTFLSVTDLAVVPDLRAAMLNSTTTNVGTLKVYTGSTLTGLATASDLRPAMLNATTTNVGTLKIYHGLTSQSATTTYLSVTSDATVTGNTTVGGYASTSGDLIVRGGTMFSGTTTPTTTMGIFSQSNAVATSTLSAGRTVSAEAATGVAGCLEMVREAAYYHCYIADTGGTLTFVCQVGRCSDRL